MLLGIHVKNFEMLKDTRVGVTGKDVLQLDNDTGSVIPLLSLTALIGKHDTGKSSLFNAMSFLSDSIRYGVRDAATMNGRRGFTRLRSNGENRPIEFELAVRLPKLKDMVLYHVVFDCDDHGRPYVREETMDHIPSDAVLGTPPVSLLRMENGQGTIRQGDIDQVAGVVNEDMTALHAYGSIITYRPVFELSAMVTRWFFCSFHPDDSRSPSAVSQTAGGHKHLAPDGRNVENVLRHLQRESPETWEKSLARIRGKMPGSRRIDDAVLDERVSMSSRRLFTYLLLLADPDPRPLICLEHPDDGLHHEMVETLAGELREFSMRHPDCQILLTTHNPNILECLMPDEVWIFERKPAGPPDNAVDAAVVRCAGADPVVRSMYGEGIGMGSMWYSGHFDPENDDAS